MPTSTERAFDRLRSANPVPDPAALATRSTPSEASHFEALRRLQMGTDRVAVGDERAPTTPDPPASRANRWMVAVVAAIIVALLAVTIPLLTRDPAPRPDEVAAVPNEDPAPGPEGATPPTLVARQVLQSAGDPSVATLFAPDAVIESATLDIEGGVEEWIQWQTWAAAIGGEWTDIECERTGGGDVACAYRQSSAIETANGVEPSEHVRTFTIENGLVTHMSEQAPEAPAGEGEAWLHFYTWLFDAHPRAERIVDPETFVPVLTPESIDLWERYTNEYVEFVGYEKTVRAMISGMPEYDPETVETMFAPGAVITAASVDSPADWAAWGDYLYAIGIERTEFTCIDGGVLGDIRCSFTYTDRIIRALGLTSKPSVVEMDITFDDDGRVVRWAEEVTLSPDAYQGAFVDFWSWIEANHPEDFASMIDLDNGYDVTLEPEIIALFEQYSQDYIESFEN